LEDAVELNVLKPREAYDLLFSVLKDDVLKTAKAMMVSDSAHRVNFARIRGFVFNALINGAIDAFMNNYEHIMNGEFSGELIGALDEGDLRRKLIVDAKEMGRTRIYVERIKTEVELGCFATFECLLDAFCTAAVECFSQIESPKGETRLSWKSQLVLRQLSDHSPIKSNPPPGGKWSKYSCLRRVLDFIAGMTDNYATSLAEQISGQMHHAVY
jgi:dGTPase